MQRFKLISLTFLALLLAACGGKQNAPAPTFTLDIQPTLSVAQGSQARLPVAVVRSAGFGGEVRVNLVNPPNGVSADAVTVPGGAAGETLTLTVSPTVAPGTLRLMVRGESTNLESSVPLELTVTGGSAPSSAELIDEALANGEIDAETALVYKVYAAFGDNRLPDVYRGDDSSVLESPILNEVVERFDSLSPQAQATLEPFFIAPFYEASWFNLPTAGRIPAAQQALTTQGPPNVPFAKGWASVDSSARVKIWYQEKHPEDRAKAESVAKEMDALIWKKLTTLMRKPLSDGNLKTAYNGGDGRYDIVLLDRDQTIPYNAKLGNGVCAAKASYILVNRGSAHLLAAVTHEFMHAVTDAYDLQESCQEYVWLSEASATWAEDFVYPNGNTEQAYAPFFLNAPETPLDVAGAAAQYHDYGAYLFPFFLANKSGRQSGAGLIAAIWANTEKAGVKSGLHAADAATGGFDTIWPEFALYNWNRVPVGYYQQWDGLTQSAKARDFDISAPGETPLPTDVAHLSARYFSFKFTSDAVRKVIIEHPFASGSEPTAKVQALVKIGGSWQEAEDWTGTEKKEFCREKPEERLEELVLIISNSEWRDASHVLRAGEAKLSAEKTPCVGSGVGTATHTSDWDFHEGQRQYTGHTTVNTSNYMFTPDPNSSDETMQAFDLTSVTASLTGYEKVVYDSGQVCEWSYSYSGTPEMSPGETMGTLIVYPKGLEGLAPAWAYTGSGGAFVEVDVTGGCDGNSTSYTEGRDLTFYATPSAFGSEASIVQPGGVLSGSWTFPSQFPVDGTYTHSSSWNFVLPGVRNEQ